LSSENTPKINNNHAKEKANGEICDEKTEAKPPTSAEEPVPAAAAAEAKTEVESAKTEAEPAQTAELASEVADGMFME
jgi:hypothetical protein